jgi:hypothetical protein
MHVEEVKEANMAEIRALNFGPNGDPCCDWCGKETPEDDLQVWVYAGQGHYSYGMYVHGGNYYSTPKCSVECEMESAEELVD